MPSERLQGRGAHKPKFLEKPPHEDLFPEVIVTKQKLGGGDGLVNSLRV